MAKAAQAMPIVLQAPLPLRASGQVLHAGDSIQDMRLLRRQSVHRRISAMVLVALATRGPHRLLHSSIRHCTNRPLPRRHCTMLSNLHLQSRSIIHLMVTHHITKTNRILPTCLTLRTIQLIQHTLFRPNLPHLDPTNRRIPVGSLIHLRHLCITHLPTCGRILANHPCNLPLCNHSPSPHSLRQTTTTA